MMAAAAINKAKSDEPEAIRNALKEVGKGYEGATGEISSTRTTSVRKLRTKSSK